MTRRNSDGARPLTARSVLASTLLGSDPPVLPVARLVAVAALFGVSEGSARVALSRMAAAGEVEPDDGRYRLAGHLLERQARQRSSRTPRLRAWRDRWVVVVVSSGRRAPDERADARATLARARLAELRAGVWVRPGNVDVVLPGPLAAASVRFTGPVAGDARALAAALWDLDAWAERANTLRADLAALAPGLASGSTAALAPGFVVSAAVLRHLQADPLLPPELLPPAWPGTALREQYDRWDRDYRRVLADWHRGAVA